MTDNLGSVIETTAAILTGGRSSRMGRDKAEVVIGDKTMLEWVSDACDSARVPTVLLGPPREGYEAIPDAVHAHGPLAGLATALDRLEFERVLLIAVDQPFVRPETLRSLVAIDSNLPIVPVDSHGTRQVTCAVYPKAIALEALEEAGQGGSLQSLLDRVSFLAVTPDTWSAWGEDGRSWHSIDHEQAIGEALARFGHETGSSDSILD